MDVHLLQLVSEQRDVVAAWQLTALDWSPTMIRRRARRDGWRRIHDGVYVLSHGPLSPWQWWRAATLTAPDTFLAAASAGACFGFREWEGSFETVVRPGSGGKRRHGPLLVARSTALDGQTTEHDGIPIVTAPLALIQLAPDLGTGQLGRGFRESIRLRTTTANEISRALAGQRGTRVLADLCDRYATIPYHRCRSDAESRALEILHDAHVAPPRVNTMVARFEADLFWPDRRLIVEIDGPQFHLFADRDAIKTAAWKKAGNTVRRLPSGAVYHHPERLLQLVNVPMRVL